MGSHRRKKRHVANVHGNSKLHDEKKSDEGVADSASSKEEFGFKHVVSFFKNFFSDTSKSKSTTKIFNYSKTILPYFFLLMIIFMAGYIRAMPAWLPATDDWARSSLNDQLRAQIGAGVDQQYPNLPPENRNRLVNEQLAEFIKTNQLQYESQVDEVSRYFKSRLQTDGGQTFLTGIDPYFWYRYSRNLIETGIPGDEVRDGVQWDSLMNAPQGRMAPLESHVWVIAWTHKLFRIFNPNVELMTSAFYVPVIVTPLALIPIFFIAKKFAGVLAGLISAFILGIHPSFLVRTMGGFSDTDPYNIIFPLFVTWFMIEALSSKEMWKTILFSSLSVLSIFLFALSWQGWWYIFLIICAALAIYFLWIVLVNSLKLHKPIFSVFKSKEVRLRFLSLGIFFIGSLFFTGLLDNFSSVIKIFFELPFRVVQIREFGIGSIWPNVLSTVAELNPSTHSQIVNSMGGNLVFIFAFLGALMTLMVRGKKHLLKEFSFIGISFVYYMFILRDPNAMRDVIFGLLLVVPIFVKYLFNFVMYSSDDLKGVTITYASIISIWFASTVFASTRGVRFTMMIVPPFALALGIFAGVIYFSLRDISVKYLGLPKKVGAPVVALLILWLFMFGPLSGSVYARGHQVGISHIPSMNRAWYITLSEIREKSSEDAIIHSWWDFGHWFKAIANRRVFFDGASQGEFPAHWTGKSLLTPEENMSLAVIRMMACGRQESYRILTNQSPGTLAAVELLYELLELNRDDAEQLLLSKNMSQDLVEEVLGYTHCLPPDVYFITSEDMVGKGGVWGHFGAWDFRRAEIYMRVQGAPNFNEGIRTLTEDYGYNENEAQRIYSEVTSTDANRWIAPWPGFMSGGTACSQRQTDLFLCRVRIQEGELNILFNSTSGDASILAAQNQYVYPHSISYIDSTGRFIHKGYDDYQVPYALSFIRESATNYRVVLLDPLQAASIFTRLFFHNAAGIKHMTRFYDIRGINGGRILVWKINWDSFLLELGDISLDDIEVPEGVDATEFIEELTSSEPSDNIDILDVGLDDSIDDDFGLGDGLLDVSPTISIEYE